MIDAIKFRILSPRVGQEEESKSGTVLENEVAGGMKMNRKIHVSCVAAGAFLVSILGASAYQRESFDVGPTYTGWTLSSIDVVTNTSSPVHLVKSLSIPVMQWVSNAVPANLTNQVWTDFWTIPTVFNSDGATFGPPIDTNATVQFFVNSNSNWTVYSGDGSNVGYKTNSTSTLDVTNHTTFHQVSVLSDYSTKKFSFFVDDVCLWKDLNFMTTNLSAAQWFQVQNLGGTAANTCYLDEYTLTNRLGGSVLTNPVPGGVVSVADAIQYFGTTNNPIPSNTTVAVENNKATWTFSRMVTGATYSVIGSTVPTGGFAAVSGAIVNSSNMIAHLGDGTNRYFEKIVAVSGVDGGISTTDTVVYAAYKQPRIAGWQWVGVPVGLSEYSLDRELGAQLGGGLSNNAKMVIYSGDSSISTYTWNTSSSSWQPEGGTLEPGKGVLIGSQNAGSTVLAGVQRTNSINAVTVASGWNTLSWPYDSDNIVWDLPPSDNGDILYIQRNNAPLIAKKVNGVWRQGRYGSLDPLSSLAVPIKAGDGIILKRNAVGTDTWSPVMPQ